MPNHRVAVVTGATRNSGYAIAERFAKEGYDVVITSRSLPDIEKATAALRKDYPESLVYGVQMDPAVVDDIKNAFADIDSYFSQIDVFVSNAAHQGMKMNLFNTLPADFDAVINTNLRGSFYGCQEAVKRMHAGSAICLISSLHARISMPDRIVYCASKGALNSLMRACAVELGHLGIRINSLVAGAIWSERWERITDDERQRRRNQYPCGRESKPEDIANAVYFLCSDQSATMTGSEMTVDSGFSACHDPYDKNWRPEI